MNHSTINLVLQSTWKLQVLGKPNRMTLEVLKGVVRDALHHRGHVSDQDFVLCLEEVAHVVLRTESLTKKSLKGIDQTMDKLQMASRRASDAQVVDQGPAAIYISGLGERADILALGLVEMGMRILTLALNDGAELEAVLQEQMPHSGLLLIGDGVLRSEEGAEVISKVAALHDTDLLVVLACEATLTFDQRLIATGFGAVRLLGVDADVKTLRNLIRSRARDSQINGYKVLLIEDTRVDAYKATKYMEAEGLEVKHINSPTEVLAAIESFRPDIVVTDYHMPTCNGDQVASVIRQDHEATMPIVFLSSEKDAETQLMALAKGADAFVQKPLTQLAFIKALKSLISRSKSSETRMRRDPLTGLLNHGQLMSAAARVCSGTAQEMGNTIVMIDIDHFKTVNDTFGHPVGDKVLLGLAEMLGDNLRSSDFIGRMGGEEVAIVMVGAGVDDTKVVIDRLRDLYAAVQFSSDSDDVNSKWFKSTFSAGVAPLQGKVSDCIKAADEALYRAKHNGRNVVMIAE